MSKEMTTHEKAVAAAQNAVDVFQAEIDDLRRENEILLKSAREACAAYMEDADHRAEKVSEQIAVLKSQAAVVSKNLELAQEEVTSAAIAEKTDDFTAAQAKCVKLENERKTIQLKIEALETRIPRNAKAYARAIAADDELREFRTEFNVRSNEIQEAVRTYIKRLDKIKDELRYMSFLGDSSIKKVRAHFEGNDDRTTSGSEKESALAPNPTEGKEVVNLETRRYVFGAEPYDPDRERYIDRVKKANLSSKTVNLDKGPIGPG